MDVDFRRLAGMSGRRRVKNYSRRPAFGIGITLIVFGSLMMIAEGVRKALIEGNVCWFEEGYCFSRILININAGLWCGAMIVFFGFFSLLTGKYETHSALVVIQGIFCLMTMGFAVTLCVVSGINIGLSFDPGASPPGIRPYTKEYIPCPDDWYLGTTRNSYNYWEWYPTTTFDWYYYQRTSTTNNYETKSDIDYYEGRKKRHEYGSDCFVRSLHVPWLTQLVLSCVLALSAIIVFVLSLITATLAFAPFCCPPKDSTNEKVTSAHKIDIIHHEPKEATSTSKDHGGVDNVSMATDVSTVTDDDAPLLRNISDSVLHV